MFFTCPSDFMYMDIAFFHSFMFIASAILVLALAQEEAITTERMVNITSYMSVMLTFLCFFLLCVHNFYPCTSLPS